MSANIIGGADGPTSIILGEHIGPDWLNIYGLLIVILMMVPNIVYAMKFRDVENRCKNKVMMSLEQIGRYASMFLMIFHIGLAERGFSSSKVFVVFIVGNTILLIAYWIIWMLYVKKIVLWKCIALAMIPTVIFLFSGITSRHYLLVISGIIFGIGHGYVTYHNAK
jgi:hypothetical protein